MEQPYNALYYKVTYKIPCTLESGSEEEIKPGGYCVTIDGERINDPLLGVVDPAPGWRDKLLCVGYLPGIDRDVIFKHVTGSHAYGTNTEKSDTDYRAVFVRDQADYAKYSYTPDMEEFRIKLGETETTYYDLKKFIQLAAVQNPNILESLFCPDDVVIKTSDEWDGVWDIVKGVGPGFVTRACLETFSGYATQQIKKARGQDKFQNMEKSKTERKTPLDFCYVPYKQGSRLLTKFLDEMSIPVEDCGLVAIPGMRDGYALFKGEPGQYRGICKEDSNDVILSSVEKGAIPVAYMQFNKDSYTQHCKRYKEYLHWTRTRNHDRWVTVESHGQAVDGKNLLHMARLLMMATDIAEGRGVVVRRSSEEIEHLLDIKHGKVDLNTAIAEAEGLYEKLAELFEKSSLPESMSIDPDRIHAEAVRMRESSIIRIYK